MNDIDFRPTSAITAEPHAVASLGGYSRVVRGVDMFTHLPTRERAAVVWIEAATGMGSLHTEEVPLDQIRIFPGRSS